MHIPLVLLVIMIIVFCLSIFGAPMWAITQVISLRGDIKAMRSEFEFRKSDIVTASAQSNKSLVRLSEIEALIKSWETRDVTTQETIRALGNKWNSRDRVDNKKFDAFREEVIEMLQTAGGDDEKAGPDLPPIPKQNGHGNPGELDLFGDFVDEDIFNG